MKRYSNDPKWLLAKYAGTCAQCGGHFVAGTRIFYFPLTKKALAGECGDRASADFECVAWDESMYAGQ